MSTKKRLFRNVFWSCLDTGAPAAGGFGVALPTARRLGFFLILVAFHTNYAASAMFLTSMASNPVIAAFAHKIGHIELTWPTWALASSVPGIVTLLLTAAVVHDGEIVVGLGHGAQQAPGGAGARPGVAQLGPARGQRPMAGRIGGGVDGGESDLLHEGQGLLELILRLAREPEDDIRR